MNTENKTGYKSRQDIPKQYKWDIEHMFPDESAIETHISEIEDGAERFTLFRGRLSSSASNLLEAFRAYSGFGQNYVQSIGNVAKSRCGQNTDFYAITKTRCSEI